MALWRSGFNRDPYDLRDEINTSSIMVRNGPSIMQGEAGAKPANCPAGSYWLNDKQMIASCDTTDVFGFAKIPAGQKNAAGQDFPADSYLVQKDGMSMTDV